MEQAGEKGFSGLFSYTGGSAYRPRCRFCVLSGRGCTIMMMWLSGAGYFAMRNGDQFSDVVETASNTLVSAMHLLRQLRLKVCGNEVHK